jgi:hypothetical protein
MPNQPDLIRRIQGLDPKHPLRRRLLNQLVIEMQASGKIWGGAGCDRDIYEEALQITWLWFCTNIDKYDCTKASIIHWFNAHLKWRIHDLLTRHPDLPFPTDKESGKPIDLIAPPDATQVMNQLMSWIQDNEARLKELHVRDNPKANAYDLIIHRIIHETKWKHLETLMGSPTPTLSNFFQSKFPFQEFWDDLP